MPPPLSLPSPASGTRGERLAIYDRRERRLVRAADLALGAAFGVGRALRLAPRRSRPDAASIRRVLLFRLERMGDLIATLPAMAEIRRALPGAQVDLVVGRWNERLARAIAPVDRVLTLDAPWIARDADTAAAASAAAPSGRELVAWARALRPVHYDLAVDFQGDIRTNLLMWQSGARYRIGFAQAGGGSTLTTVLAHDASIYMGDLAMRAAAAVGGDVAARSRWRVHLPDDAVQAAAALLNGLAGPIAAIHPSAGRAIKQWPADRFAAVADRLAEAGVSVILTGATADRALVDAVLASARARSHILDFTGRTDALVLGAVFARIAAVVTPDTGPMHLAAALGTPVVAIFGPSEPSRYFPPGDPRSRLVRIDLPCSPCNRIRLPPARCVGHTPDCLTGIDTSRVVEAVRSVLGSG